MRERVVAEVTRIGHQFNIRLLYGEDRKMVRYASSEVKDFACYMLRKTYDYEARKGVVLYNFDKNAYVSFTDPKTEHNVAIEGGEAMTSYDAVAFLYRIDSALKNLDICGSLELEFPDLGLEFEFERGSIETKAGRYFN